MVVLLKIILGLLSIANVLVFRFIYKDFYKVRKSEGYDSLSIWEKFRFSSVFFFILTMSISFLVFLMYFIIVPIQILI